MTEDYDDELQRSKVFTNFRMCANLNIFFIYVDTGMTYCSSGREMNTEAAEERS